MQSWLITVVVRRSEQGHIELAGQVVFLCLLDRLVSPVFRGIRPDHNPPGALGGDPFSDHRVLPGHGSVATTSASTRIACRNSGFESLPDWEIAQRQPYRKPSIQASRAMNSSSSLSRASCTS